MCFRLFDREENDFFGYQIYEDILEENLIPNFKKIVKKERANWLAGHTIQNKKKKTRKQMR